MPVVRLLQVSPFHPADVTKGGPIHLIRQLAQERRSSSYRPVGVVAPSYDGAQTLDFHTIECRQISKYRTAALTELAPLKSALHRCDLVLIHGYRHWLSYWGARYAARLDVPYILHLHGMATRLFRSKFKKRVFDIACGRAMIRRCAGIVFSSQVEYRCASELLPDIGRHWIIPNPVESVVCHDHMEARSRWNALLGLDPARPLVVSIGRVNRTKNFEALIGALTGERPLNLVIAGPPEERNYWRRLEDAAKRLSGSRVLMLPGVYGGEKHSLLAAADVFETASMVDSFNLTVAEALFQGTPCVYPVWLGVHEHLDSPLCIPISSLENTALASALHRALQIPRQPAGTVDPFNWNTLLQRFEKVFTEVCQPLRRVAPVPAGSLT